MKRSAKAVWNGSIKDGSGSFGTGSGAIQDQTYTFRTRFEDAPGTNPEELIAAAHAGCFSMALSAQLEKAGFTANEVRTTARVKLEQKDGGFAITTIHLDTQASVPNIDKTKLQELAEGAKKGCPVSKVLNAEITMNARLS